MLKNLTNEDMKRKVKFNCNSCGWEWYINAFSNICTNCKSSDINK